MKISGIIWLGLLLMSFINLQPAPHGKLIVLIAVDGLRGDLLAKYKPAFKHGFKRMFDEGFDYKYAWDNHAITVSHAGHVTLATGNYPRTHGIVDAAFYEKKGDSLAFTDAFADSAYSLPGISRTKSISTQKVLTPGLAEWVKKQNPSAKVLCVGTGEISPALYCFHTGEPVYWYNVEQGRYVTSTYFLNEDPAWVKQFNEQQLPGFIKMSKEWTNIVPQQFISLANKDDADFENGGEKHVFPYAPSERAKKANNYKSWFRFPPFCDNATLALAKAGIDAMKMGQTTGTDYLSIVLSQVDNTNHGFGPSSLETMNVLMQMDIALGDFYAYLDKKTGKGNYIVALSADHGFPEIPEQTLKKGKPAKRLTEKEIESTLNDVNQLIKTSPGLTQNQLQGKIKSYLLKQTFIADAYTSDQLQGMVASKDKYLELYKKSYRPDRVPRLPFFLAEYFSVGYRQNRADGATKGKHDD